jgi:hypothetical protein
MGTKRNANMVSVRETEGRRPLGRPRTRWENNIKIDLREIGFGGMEWNDLAQDMGRMEGSREHGNEPSVSIKCVEIFE